MTEANHTAYPLVFPTKLVNGIVTDQTILTGLSKREIFAMTAMQGILSNPTYDKWDEYTDISKDAVNAADALIEQLNKQ